MPVQVQHAGKKTYNNNLSLCSVILCTIFDFFHNHSSYLWECKKNGATFWEIHSFLTELFVSVC